MADSDPDLYPTLIHLADALVAGFDVLDVADHVVLACTRLVGADAAGIMLDDQRGTLRVLASSSEDSEHLEMLEIQTTQGPCLQAFSTGQIVAAPHLPDASDRWPTFVAEATRRGIGAAYAMPMRLRDNTIGAVNLFCATGRSLDRPALQLGHLVADMAAIGIVTNRTLREHEMLAEQLHAALNSRIVIEQAKGVIAERSQVGMGEAFQLLRTAARATRRPIAQVAADVASGRLAPTSLARMRPDEPTAREAHPGPQ